MTESRNQTTNRRKVVVNGRVIEDATEHISNVTSDMESSKNVSGQDMTNAMILVNKMGGVGRWTTRVSIICSVIACLLAIAPLVWSWCIAVFWILYFFGVAAVVSAIISLFNHRRVIPIIAILLSVAAMLIPFICIREYTLAAASSVNSVTSITKLFIDALNWPF